MLKISAPGQLKPLIYECSKILSLTVNIREDNRLDKSTLTIGGPKSFLSNHYISSHIKSHGLTILLVDEIKGYRGYANFTKRLCVVDKGAEARTLAHEIAHLLGLPHSNSKDNLMYSGGNGTSLDWWQKAILKIVEKVSYGI